MLKKISLLLFLICIQTLTAQVANMQKTDSLKLEEVTIISKKKNQFKTTSKLDVPLRDMPMTLNVISGEVLKQQGVDDMVSAMRNVSGVRPVATYGAFQNFVIRGFQDFVLLIDGFRDERHNISNSAPMSNLANVDRIEVLKGPASVLYGHSALGGVINVIRKKPSFVPQYDFSVGYGSFNNRRITAGAAGAITKKVAYRTDFGISEDTGWRKAGSSRSTAYLALDYNIAKNEQLNFQIGLSKDRYNNDAGIPIDPLTNAFPIGVKLDNRYNVPQDFLDFKRMDLQLRYSKTLKSGLSLTNSMGYTIDDIDYFSTESLNLTADKTGVERGYFNFNHKTKPFQNTLDLAYSLKKCGIEHKLIAGYSLGLLDRKTFWDNPLRSKMASTLSFVNPQENQGLIPTENDKVRNINEVSHGFYLQDYIVFSPKLKALIAGRYDIFNGKYSTDDIATATQTEKKGVESDRNSTALTYRLGLVFQPTTQLTLFSSYSTFFKPSRQVPTDDSVLYPEKGNQWEAGLRFDINPFISLNTSAYTILKNDMVVSLGAGKFDQASAARSKGIETELTAQWTKGFQTIAGYAYTDARFESYTSKVAGAGNLADKTLQFVPKNQFNIWSSYQIQSGILDGFAIGAGGNYSSSNFTNTKNTVELAAYTLVNTSFSYSVNGMKINFLINNVLNSDYFTAAINGTQLYPGAPRNYMMVLSYKF
jgi:iron complex outermembrane receptor protein